MLTITQDLLAENNACKSAQTFLAPHLPVTLNDTNEENLELAKKFSDLYFSNREYNTDTGSRCLACDLEWLALTFPNGVSDTDLLNNFGESHHEKFGVSGNSFDPIPKIDPVLLATELTRLAVRK